ncbi:type II toxin-antitoxin system VapC family toxin [Kocuria sp.]|uniref:type II toxin-antitoxin system VapC family toxin n=1 Tax=Kocuria sp. TaxID=1871328 RepID=UPI0026E0C9BE|nr:type II toxin-antitoxin system VapC family toxin [Kocuria sp.]MDO5617962.1 type II toxin-antitoxin system VapC family toxin [Kocuria sp.]
MTSLLLDTHTLIWAINEPDRLGTVARSLILDTGNDLFVSAGSAWELHTKHRIGKLPDAGSWLASLENHIMRLGARVLDITWQHAKLAGDLDWSHRDPFDRMLAAQALTESLTLVSTDRVFDDLSPLTVAW